VLQSYTPINSYYKLVKTVESDPEFETRRANKKLRRYVESHDQVRPHIRPEPPVGASGPPGPPAD
jgi:hypothetical protein